MNAKHPISQALWDQTPTTIQDFIDAPEARGASLEGTVQRLEAMVQRVILQVQQNSHNSSRPPLIDDPPGPWQTVSPRAQWTSTGEQPGYEEHTRAVVVEVVDVVVPVNLERYRYCQHPLQGEDP